MKGECGHVIALSFVCCDMTECVVFEMVSIICDMWMVRLITRKILEKIQIKQNWQLAIQTRKVSKVQN